ncbi:MAG TPA: 8-amino-7-oxononanoate synthase [Dissulfurispiraceae bacterium]
MFRNELEKLKQHSLFRRIRDRSGPPARMYIDGLEYRNFASNDYLGLAAHPYVREAAKKAIDNYGFGAGASRLLAGGTALHGELERAAADFKGTGAALICNSGYSANVGAIPALAGEGAVIFSDELNHASIIDGCRLSRARTVVFRHRDVSHLSELMKREKGRRRIIVTDTVFSMDGDIAPIGKLHELCTDRAGEAEVILYLDDAHGTGVLGGGRGALSHFGISPESRPGLEIIQMGTCSKALGSFGAFIAADKEIIEWLTNTGRGFIYSTALPSSAIAASLAALELIRTEPQLIERLWDNRKRLFQGIRALGFDTMGSESPIIPIIVGDVKATGDFAEKLLRRGIFAPAIRPPTVRVPRIRVTVSAAHTQEDIDALLDALKTLKSEK